MKLVISILLAGFLSGTVLLVFDHFIVAHSEHRVLLFGGEGGILAFIIALFSIFTGPGRRRFLSCQLGFNVCLCNFEDFREAILQNKDSKNMCFSTTLSFEEEIDVSGKTFRIGCDGDLCGLRPSTPNRFFVGSPEDAVFDSLSFSDGSSDDGGAMKVTGGKVTCINCSFFRNSASQDGGAIYVSSGELVLDSPIFSDNTATGNGGGIFVTSGAIVSINGESDEADIMFDHYFNFNSASQGGAVAVENGLVDMKDTDFFCGNRADISGDNIFVGSGATVTCDNVSFERDRGLSGNSSPSCESSAIMGDGSATFCTR